MKEMVLKIACNNLNEGMTSWLKASRFQDTINRFSAGLKDDREYLERRADKESCKMLSYFGAWMAGRVIEAHQSHFETSKVTIKQHTSG